MAAAEEGFKEGNTLEATAKAAVAAWRSAQVITLFSLSFLHATSALRASYGISSPHAGLASVLRPGKSGNNFALKKPTRSELVGYSVGPQQLTQLKNIPKRLKQQLEGLGHNVNNGHVNSSVGSRC